MSDRVRRLGAAIQRWRPTGNATAPRDLAWRVGAALAVALLTLLLFPSRGPRQVPVLRAGTVAPEDVIAPIDFEVPRGEADLARRREQASLTVPPVYTAVPGAADSALAAVSAYLDRAAAATKVGADDLSTLNRVDGRGLGLRPSELKALRDPDVRARILAFSKRTLPDLYSDAWLLPEDDLGEVSSAQIAVQRPGGEETLVPRSAVVGLAPGAEISALARPARDLEPPLERISLQLLPGLIPPNVRPRPSLTAIRRQEARDAVEPIEGEVLEGELIVAAHTRVTPEQERKLRALRSEMERLRGGFTPEDLRVALGRLLLNAALLFLFGVYLFLYRRDVFDDMRSVAVLAVVWGIMVGIGAFADRVDAVPGFAAPVALASVLVAVLWDTRLSAVTTLFLVAYLASQGDLGFPLLWVGLLGGLAGGWSVRRIRRRTHFYESLLFIMVGDALAVGGLALARLWSWSTFGTGLAWVVLGAALAVFLAMGLLPVLEWASGRTTDLTLLELADLNRPLLKRLLLEAPGSYHHSILVGNLAEAAVEGIGGNSLLARVGAYYHDIGKLRRPEYFAENQRQGVNPHSALDPRESARIVRLHVEEGVRMARAAGLPEIVVDFVREHHGTTLLSYFWHEARETAGSEPPDEADFHYPGPRPRSKETAVVMLADSVEAASRVVSEPTAERFREMTRRIVQIKLDERQLEEAGLTFRDLAAVEAKFTAVLAGIHHHRIEYPSVPLGPAPGEVEDEPADSIPRVGRAPA